MVPAHTDMRAGPRGAGALFRMPWDAVGRDSTVCPKERSYPGMKLRAPSPGNARNRGVPYFEKLQAPVEGQ